MCNEKFDSHNTYTLITFVSCDRFVLTSVGGVGVVGVGVDGVGLGVDGVGLAGRWGWARIWAGQIICCML